MVMDRELEAKAPRKRGLLTSMAELIASRFPDLKKKLRIADMDDNPMDFVEKVLFTSSLLSAGLIILYFIMLAGVIGADLKSDVPMAILLIVAPLVLIPLFVFYYLMLLPDDATIRRQKEMDYEIVFAGRHIVIALKSGMPLFDTFIGASSGYGPVSREFAKIVDQVMLGVPTTQAIREAVAYNPSKYFTRMMMQIANALSSGADVGDSLEGVLDQISKEQMISLKEYSQKLTPIVMFYMVFGIIVPTLGIVLGTVILMTLGSRGLPPGLLAIAFVMIALVQFLFLGFVESSRPKYLI
ncbi:MAG: type II secretion system F family protein [Candidatus Micrarchaeota archaeon]